MPVMEDIAEVAGARRSRSLEEPASPSPDFNFAGSDARNGNTNWLLEGQLPPGFAGSSINSQLPLFQDFPVAYSPIQQGSGGAPAEADSYDWDNLLRLQDFLVASDYSPIQQGSGGALAEVDPHDWDNLLTTSDTGSSYDPYYGSHLDVSNPAPTPAPTPASTPASTPALTSGAPTPQSQASDRGGLSPLAIGRNPNPSRQVSLPHKTQSF
jgi:hypothetical protein